MGSRNELGTGIEGWDGARDQAMEWGQGLRLRADTLLGS